MLYPWLAGMLTGYWGLHGRSAVPTLTCANIAMMATCDCEGSAYRVSRGGSGASGASAWSRALRCAQAHRIGARGSRRTGAAKASETLEKYSVYATFRPPRLARTG